MKKLLAVSIAATLSSFIFTSAHASPTIYGQLHASVDVFDGADGNTDDTTVSSNSSRLGVKGSSDLDGNLKAVYLAEFGLDTGSGANSGLIDRNQWVGIEGGFGTVFVGRHDTPLKTVGRKADLFWSTQIGQNRSIVREDVNWDARPEKVIGYKTPKTSGLNSTIMYITDSGDDNDNSAISVNGLYTTGDLLLGFGFEDRNAPVAANEANALRMFAKYNYGNGSVVAYYQDADNGAANDDTVIGLGGTYKVSTAGTLKAQYYTRDEDGAADDGKLFAVGYDHNMGKAVDVYVQYAMTENTGGIGGAGHDESVAANADGDASAMSAGVRVKF